MNTEHQKWMDEMFDLLLLANETGYARFDSLFLLAEIVRHFKPRAPLELGTMRGCSSVFIAKALTPGAKLTCIDSFKFATQEQVRSKLDRFRVSDRIELIQGDTQRAGKLLKGKHDFVFFDASHDAGGLIAEFESVVPHIESPAVLVVDDYMCAPEALNKIAGQNLGFKTYPVHFGMGVFVR